MKLSMIDCLPGSEHESAFIFFLNKHRAHKTNQKAFTWQFSFMRESSVVMGIENEGVIMGSQAMMPFPLYFSGVSIISGKCENTYVEAELRGTGKFGELFNKADQRSSAFGMVVLWGFTPAIKPYQKLGFSVVENGLVSYSVPLNYTLSTSSSLPQKIKGAMHRMAIHLGSMLATKWARQLKQKNRVLIARDHAIQPTDTATLLQKIFASDPKGIYLDLTPEFLNWRIEMNPNVDYKSIYYYDENNVLEAHCIYAEHRGTCRIHSLLIRHTDSLRAVCGDLFLRFKHQGYSHMTYQGNLQHPANALIFEAFQKLGLRKLNPTGEHFIFRIDPSVQPDEIKPSMWFLNRLWTEGYA